MIACRDEEEVVRGEGVGVGVLCGPEAAGTSTTVGLQPSLRCAGLMLKISNLLSRDSSCGVGEQLLAATQQAASRHGALEHHESSRAQA